MKRHYDSLEIPRFPQLLKKKKKLQKTSKNNSPWLDSKCERVLHIGIEMHKSRPAGGRKNKIKKTQRSKTNTYSPPDANEKRQSFEMQTWIGRLLDGRLSEFSNAAV